MLTVYTNPYSQHARRVQALLEIAGIDYRNEVVNLGAGDQYAAPFSALNPNHQVPVLIDGDLLLTESNAILRYLCDKHELVDWYPTDLAERAVVDQWLDWNQCRLAQPVTDVVLNTLFAGDNADPDAITRGGKNLVEPGEILAARLKVNDYVAGDSPTIADLAIASNLSQLGLLDAIYDDASTRDWYARMCDIDGFSRTLPPPLEQAA